MSLDHDLYVIDPSNHDTNMHQLRDCLKDAIYELAERTASLSERLNKLENEAATTDNNVLSTEPLIKDEKICKAVRAWAEADDLDNFRVKNEHFNACKIIGYTAGINKASFIGFQTTIAHADSKKLYAIAELCGEGENERL